jgi:uncharacterized protein YdeI (YjbR/CyaY-like superfamily)
MQPLKSVLRLREAMPGRPPGKPRFFATPEAFDAWLARHGEKRRELLVGYWKVGTGKPSMTWPQSVEAALRHGWIDGIRRSLGDEAYCIRFTPRKPGSHWSAINVRTARRLVAAGRMAPAGARAFAARRADRTAKGPYELRKPLRLDAAARRRLQADAKAWAWFRTSPPSYQRACAHWVQTAKRPETRERRLALLAKHARLGEVVPQYRWSKAGKAGAAGSRSGKSN